ncbi:4Fe-4S dicluster domain-containing protein [Nitratiruptor sp. YY09-18]|uniref:4Fe-4S dicluster domain-containing protein n=1 Tax=Nitratiruptor sp. YY09-18 TaxID=2724901 RepID=UPI0019152C9F|nr:4Fe-4S binding protein [Nitratiruptor sp. YY09-18]BCD68422.1 ferredoxin [Nitratiruptor sp. YY09-18]
MIQLNPASCVRYYAKSSECNKCEVICPTEAIKVAESAVNIYQNECIECGACMGVCPTEALSLNNFDVTEFFFDFIKSDESVISCKSNFLCLAALSVDHLLSLALVKDFVLDIGHCATCDIKERCFVQIESNIAEANYVLSTISDKEIQAQKIGVTKEDQPNRREFFNIFTLKGAATLHKQVKEEIEALENPEIGLSSSHIQAIRQKNIPNKRKLLFTILKRMEKPAEYKYLENEYLSFTSDKVVDESCDNCSICYRVCPTQALSSDKRFSTIYFDPLLCVKCHLCHDVCEKGSIQITEYFDTKEFFEPEQKVLKKFKVIRCIDCGNPFTYFSGEQVCPRCKIEEEEAKSLWGIE